jgi:hypothetical protein
LNYINHKNPEEKICWIANEGVEAIGIPRDLV